MRAARQWMIGLLISVAIVPIASAQNQKIDEHFSAVLTNISNVGGTGLTPVDLHITRWTGPEANERLLTILRNEGQEAFLRALQDEKTVGWIATPTSLRYDFYYATFTPTDEGGRRIILITDRPMQMWERLGGSPTRDYPFTVIELRVDKSGNGQGTLAQMVQLRLSGDVMGVENWATSPMRLNEVKKVK
jgi:hypothetical protein